MGEYESKISSNQVDQPTAYGICWCGNSCILGCGGSCSSNCNSGCEGSCKDSCGNNCTGWCLEKACAGGAIHLEL